MFLCVIVSEQDVKKPFSCLKMRAQIWGYLGQMAHRRQIAQWSGPRTARPGFETGPSPKLGNACPHSRRGVFGS